ncbi:predicted protein [Botrytis cinerea T4]|uniref:Uncharacterized protein n=1 Tax=Botryotinia fuckeliana (strain T4) TaxID=999810 RepID=G2Y8H1_BOTF4|nr:predicted protein [Botrytis cinerea T4]
MAEHYSMRKRAFHGYEQQLGLTGIQKLGNSGPTDQKSVNEVNITRISMNLSVRQCKVCTREGRVKEHRQKRRLIESR